MNAAASNTVTPPFSNDTLLIPDSQVREIYDTRHPVTQYAHSIVSFFREVSFLIFDTPSSVGLYSTPQWKVDSQGLYVLVHGLNGSPGTWESHVKKINRIPQIDIYTPVVLKAGNCRLKECLPQIIAKIVSYTKRFPFNPVCLIGESNGSRVALALEVQMRTRCPTTPVRVSTVAGVVFGSPAIQIGKSITGLLSASPESIGCSKPIFEELECGSETVARLFTSVCKKPPRTASRSYEFFSSTEDLLASNLTLPKIKHGDMSCIVKHGFGHMSLKSHVEAEQLNNADDWMKKVKIKNTFVDVPFEVLKTIGEYLN